MMKNYLTKFSFASEEVVVAGISNEAAADRRASINRNTIKIESSKSN